MAMPAVDKQFSKICTFLALLSRWHGIAFHEIKSENIKLLRCDFPSPPWIYSSDEIGGGKPLQSAFQTTLHKKVRSNFNGPNQKMNTRTFFFFYLFAINQSTRQKQRRQWMAYNRITAPESHNALDVNCEFVHRMANRFKSIGFYFHQFYSAFATEKMQIEWLFVHSTRVRINRAY